MFKKISEQNNIDVSDTMNRAILLTIFLSSNLHASEIKPCKDRKLIDRGIMSAPRATELREGSALISAIVDAKGNVTSTKVLSQKGDPRWREYATRAMQETIFEPASKACRFEFNYVAKFEGNENDH